MPMTQITDIDRFQELLLTELPRLLHQRPEFRYKVQEIILPSYQDDIKKLLQEIRELREESNRRFEASERRFEEVNRRFEEQAAETRALREEMNQRFEKVDQRFEKVDQRFEKVDQRFEKVDQRFDKVDQRFDKIDQRFEKVDQRFDKIDQRFEDTDNRIDKSFKEMQRSIDKLGSRWGIRNESIFRQTIATLLEESYGVKVETRWIGGDQFDVIIANGEHILVEITASAGPKIQKALERKRRIYTETIQAPTRIILAAASIHSHRARTLEEAGFEVIEPEELDIDD
jgi:hypothetical protein